MALSQGKFPKQATSQGRQGYGMRIVFMGTPVFAATILDYMVEQHQVIGVFTQPDAIRSRGKKLVASPVKNVALRHNLPVFEYATLSNNDATEVLYKLAPDIICVAAYGCIVPQEILNLPTFGCVNVHASLLPRWRGAAPVERAILAGDECTGISIMRMDAGLDTGDYCVTRSVEIAQNSARELTDILADLGAEALLSALSQIEQGCVAWIKQDETQATYAPKIKKGELDITPELFAVQGLRNIQASSDAHPCRCSIALKPVTVLKARPLSLDEAREIKVSAGQVSFINKRLWIGCVDKPIELLEVKPAGKNAMAASAFALGIQGIKQQGALWQGVHDV